MLTFLARLFRLRPDPPGSTRAILAEHWANERALRAARDTWRETDWFRPPLDGADKERPQ